MIVNINDIVIPNAYKFTKPEQYRINLAKDYVERYGDSDCRIKLYKGILVDGYIRYLACRSIGLKYVNVEETDNPHNILQEEYVIGRFDGCNKLYVWRNKDKLPINVGDYVVVKNADGQLEEVYVVKCTLSDNKNMLRHKNIIGVKH